VLRSGGGLPRVLRDAHRDREVGRAQTLGRVDERAHSAPSARLESLQGAPFRRSSDRRQGRRSRYVGSDVPGTVDVPDRTPRTVRRQGAPSGSGQIIPGSEPPPYRPRPSLRTARVSRHAPGLARLPGSSHTGAVVLIGAASLRILEEMINQGECRRRSSADQSCCATGRVIRGHGRSGDRSLARRDPPPFDSDSWWRLKPATASASAGWPTPRARPGPAQGVAAPHRSLAWRGAVRHGDSGALAPRAVR
jgi:hypothetical protein